MASAFLWAVSALVVNLGLNRIPAQQRREGVLCGLLVAQVGGVVLLGGMVYQEYGGLPFSTSPYVVLSGLLTFPIATGMYYLAGSLFGGRAEYAAQFAKVKPLLSITLAVAILHEPISTAFSLPTMFMVLGVMVFMVAGLTGSLNWQAISYGFMTALAWALGEVFMSLGMGENNSLVNSFSALVAGLLASAGFLIPSAMHTVKSTSGREIFFRLWPFFLHGILSFALGYSLFFHSIHQIGLAATVLINAFWPVTSIMLGCILRRALGKPCDVKPVIWAASLLLLLGSLIHTYRLF